MPSCCRLVAVFAAVCLFATSCSEGDDGFEFVAADDVGDDPFTSDLATPVPVEFVDLRDQVTAAADEAEAAAEAETTSAEIRQVRLAAATTVAEQNGLSVIAPPSPRGVGLYGGSGVNACDVEGLIGFLREDPAKAAAWAGVQGIEVSEIESFVRSLTPGFLIDNTAVINHTFSGGDAKAIPSTLEAGTAVLVDDQGIPRARCKCGNPLQHTLQDLDLSGRWYGYGYTCFGDPKTAEEVIEIEIDGDQMAATKVEGDDCVESGEMTFIATWDGARWVTSWYGGRPGADPTITGSGHLEVLSESSFTDGFYGITFERERRG